ncbi:hypothetical protein P175DRAFT_0498613 [Aspergillus ochraceoroseus IBT 24754]|uniref:Uncharacterized protein n=1 Tax=Aspergillus ochraceoroseus IBT 24754 TaxID=1392256 RepID=A0A2T5MAH7_9EURO|nr:uncharacterized protein P175DRAFT_0498613 [Aspergillus ochraceoroseus IBT 24754]PTU25505.1 hypothetical protein P175DRAFT_0498613 [Aspergillus ochraceoroseus IBT 24754]
MTAAWELLFGRTWMICLCSLSPPLRTPGRRSSPRAKTGSSTAIVSLVIWRWHLSSGTR